MTIVGFIGITLESANRQRTIGRRFAVLAGYACSAWADKWAASFYGGKARASRPVSLMRVNRAGGYRRRFVRPIRDKEVPP
jgi:hypothetical protein